MKPPKKRVFTDEDLLRLEGSIKAHKTHLPGFVRVLVQPDDVEALIARLKAAEKVIALVDARNRNDYWDAHSKWPAVMANGRKSWPFIWLNILTRRL